MGYIDPNHIDNVAYKEEGEVVFSEDEDAPLESSNTNKNWSPVAIVHRFIQRSAQRAVREQLTGVYACLVAPPNPNPDPAHNPTVATAAAAADAFEAWEIQ